MNDLSEKLAVPQQSVGPAVAYAKQRVLILLKRMRAEVAR